MATSVLTSLDGNLKGLDNTFPDGDKPVIGTPFPVGTTAISIQLEADGSQSNEVIVQVVGGDGTGCHFCFSDKRDATTDDIMIPSGTMFSLPNNGKILKAIGSDGSIVLRMFYSCGV